MTSEKVALQKNGLRTFDGAVVVMTGGASGIGRSMAEALAKRGANLVLLDRQIELAHEVVDGIREMGGSAEAAEVDVTHYEVVEEAIAQTFENHGRLDYLFNNAGIGIGGEAALYELEHWHRILDVNLRGVVHGVQAAYPRMLEQGFGHIVSTSSMAGLTPSPGIVAYGASKHGVVGLTRALRVEAAPAGIHVSALCPGAIRTPILEGGRYGEFLREYPPGFLEKVGKKMGLMDPDAFAIQALAGVAKKREIIIVPGRWKLLWWLDRLSPALTHRLVRYFFEVQKRELDRIAPHPSSSS